MVFVIISVSTTDTSCQYNGVLTNICFHAYRFIRISDPCRHHKTYFYTMCFDMD